MDKIIIKYQSSKKEITEREISNVYSQVAENKNKIISAYCHLRESVRTFILDSIIEVNKNDEILEKEQFWKDHINDKKKLLKELEKLLAKKKKEYEEYVEYMEYIMKSISEK
jgi:predicted DNA-binding transcriptional regulator YafY